MAHHLASIYGTEKDKVNCSFYFKIGACRHGDRCSRKHVKPTFSQTVLLANVYHNPSHDPNCHMTEEELQEHFDLFFEDMFVELAKYGEVEEMNVCDNVGDHLVGNVYIRYALEEDAQNAVDALNQRFYAGRPLYTELSPVTDFREACCRQYENSECQRGGFCNFMHLKNPSRKLRRDLLESQKISMKMLGKESHGEYGDQRRSRSGSGSRSRSRDRRRSRSRERRRSRRDDPYDELDYSRRGGREREREYR
ncbi:splicing factor U2AF 26 kDa subunit [Polychytrium aggregatum]|uniref:splicing factor U2AF 26 kDa subunit n=1 Tax=Polychytrium aggregatum TaxID=110093 RepID=UPI0022FEAF97|nr:splicing factor U2AF 26 kDa subunit [Polychytrium aggregatum]KAI9193085.1 splicing factor U2AF 26 kDa subunit [Polychytrium aggregatum]